MLIALAIVAKLKLALGKVAKLDVIFMVADLDCQLWCCWMLRRELPKQQLIKQPGESTEHGSQLATVEYENACKLKC